MRRETVIKLIQSYCRGKRYGPYLETLLLPSDLNALSEQYLNAILIRIREIIAEAEF